MSEAGRVQATRASDFLSYNEQHFGDPYAMKSTSTTSVAGAARHNFTTDGVLMDKPVRSLTKVQIEPRIKFRRPGADELPRPTSPGHTSQFFLGGCAWRVPPMLPWRRWGHACIA